MKECYQLMVTLSFFYINSNLVLTVEDVISESMPTILRFK